MTIQPEGFAFLMTPYHADIEQNVSSPEMYFYMDWIEYVKPGIQLCL